MFHCTIPTSNHYLYDFHFQSTPSFSYFATQFFNLFFRLIRAFFSVLSCQVKSSGWTSSPNLSNWQFLCPFFTILIIIHIIIIIIIVIHIIIFDAHANRESTNLNKRSASRHGLDRHYLSSESLKVFVITTDDKSSTISELNLRQHLFYCKLSAFAKPGSDSVLDSELWSVYHFCTLSTILLVPANLDSTQQPNSFSWQHSGVQLRRSYRGLQCTNGW